MSDHRELERRIADLEAGYQTMQRVIFALTDAVKPARIQYPLLALMYGFTAEQEVALNQYWKWAVNQDKENLTREALIQEFDTRMPQPLKGKLEEILRAYHADGGFSLICRIVLGEQSQPADATVGDDDDV